MKHNSILENAGTVDEMRDIKCNFTLENAKTLDDVRYMTACAYNAYRRSNGNEMDVATLCGNKTRDDYVSIIFESKNMEEAIARATEVWQKEHTNSITSIQEFKKFCENGTFEKIVYLVKYPEIKGTITISDDLFRVLKNRILLKGEDGVLIKLSNGNLIRICLMQGELFDGIKVFKEKIFPIEDFVD